MLNYTVQTPTQKKFWRSRNKINRLKAIIAFSLNEANANDNLRKAGYSLQWRDKALIAFREFINKPEMDGMPFSEMEDKWWLELPFVNWNAESNVGITSSYIKSSYGVGPGFGSIHSDHNTMRVKHIYFTHHKNGVVDLTVTVDPDCPLIGRAFALKVDGEALPPLIVDKACHIDKNVFILDSLTYFNYMKANTGKYISFGFVPYKEY